MTKTDKVLFTLGHSNHGPEKFVELLQTHAVELVADVRSQPVSRFSPHFRKQTLRELLEAHGVAYVWLPELGGRPKDLTLYDAEGRPDYAKMGRTEGFREGLGTVQRLMAERRTALLCSEENPDHCHRRLLVVRALIEEGVVPAAEILHVRKDGSAQTEAELAARAPTRLL